MNQRQCQGTRIACTPNGFQKARHGFRPTHAVGSTKLGTISGNRNCVGRSQTTHTLRSRGAKKQTVPAPCERTIQPVHTTPIFT